MNGNLLRIMSSSELEKHVKERQLYRYCTLERAAHMWKCNLGLPDPVGVDVTAGSVLTGNQ